MGGGPLGVGGNGGRSIADEPTQGDRASPRKECVEDRNLPGQESA